MNFQAWMHKEADAPFVWAAIALYSFDSLMRWIKTRVHTAIARPLPELGMTRLEIPQINAGWRAGQHVRLRVLSSGMGLFGWAEVHPFTIASASDGPEGMILMIKKVGGWTNKLFDISSSGGYTEAGVGRNVTVMVEGPYGAFLASSQHELYLRSSFRRTWTCYSCQQFCRCLRRGWKWNNVCPRRHKRAHSKGSEGRE